MMGFLGGSKDRLYKNGGAVTPDWPPHRHHSAHALACAGTWWYNMMTVDLPPACLVPRHAN